MNDSVPSPPLKWAGGKRWLFQLYAGVLPHGTKRYIEPFLGGGAAFFAYKPSRAILSDVNEDLINLYRCIKSVPDDLARLMRRHHQNHSSSYYYEMRDYAPRNQLNRAARFLYLNRTCWNGLYRVNRQGKFNVPIGTKSHVFGAEETFEHVSNALANAELLVSDFEPAIAVAGKGDFIFADPPYTVKHNLNGFVKYNERIFSWQDQERLARALRGAKSRGAKIFLTNANHPSIRELYQEDFSLCVVDRASVISGTSAGRGPTSELIVQ